MLGTKSCGASLEYRLQLDVMATNEVRYTYLPREIHGVHFSTYHNFLCFFEFVESYMADNFVVVQAVVGYSNGLYH